MTTTETLKLALEALETGGWNKTTAAITALREALASQGEALTSVPDWTSEAIEQPAQQWQSTADKCELQKVPANGSLLPAQRQARSADTWVNATTWRGLTDEEIDQGLLRSDYAFKTAEAWRAGVVFAMTKLKEKNCG